MEEENEEDDAETAEKRNYESQLSMNEESKLSGTALRIGDYPGEGRSS